MLLEYLLLHVVLDESRVTRTMFNTGHHRVPCAGLASHIAPHLSQQFVVGVFAHNHEPAIVLTGERVQNILGIAGGLHVCDPGIYHQGFERFDHRLDRYVQQIRIATADQDACRHRRRTGRMPVPLFIGEPQQYT